MKFQRTGSVPKYSNYQDYRPFLRKDFLFHCAYCTGHEDEMGGAEHFEIDHHKPTKKFPKLKNEYTNLYYSCRGCNMVGSKGQNWPTQKQLKNGFRFIDPIIENPYLVHFRESNKGKLIDKTNAGKYSIKIIRLNRNGLIRLRNERRRMRALLREELEGLLDVIEEIKKRGKKPSADTLKRLDLVKKTLNEKPVLKLLPDWWGTKF